LRKSGYDCRAGNHGHKRESNQNVVHLCTPSGETLEPVQGPARSPKPCATSNSGNAWLSSNE
jgi:hypothetical protein